MAERWELDDVEDDAQNMGERLTYIKPIVLEEAKRLGIVPPGITLPQATMLYVLHSVDGAVLGFTDGWESAYGAAVQNEMTPLSVH